MKGRINRTNVRGRRSNASSQPAAIMNMTKASVPRNLRIEQKYYESINNMFGMPYSGQCDGVCAGIVNGTTLNQRIGSRVQYTYVSLRGVIEPDSAVPVMGRIMILYDKEQNTGTFATTAGLLLKTPYSGATITALAQYDPLYLDRFKVLFDKSYGIQPVSSFAESNMIPVDVTIPLNLPGVWNTGTVPRGSIVLCLCGYYASGDPNFNYTFRVGFTDD